MKNKRTFQLLAALVAAGILSQTIVAIPDRMQRPFDDDEYEFWQDDEDRYDYPEYDYSDDDYYDDYDGNAAARGALGGAATGALLGGIFGGGRGAAIGAGTGAGIGLLSGASVDESRRRRRANWEERRRNERDAQRERRRAQHEKRARTQPVEETEEYY